MTLPASNIVKRLRAREANDVFFRELASVLSAVEATIDSEELRLLACSLVPPTELEARMRVDLDTLANGCRYR